MINKTVVRLNNLAVRMRRARCRPEELLLLLSRCLQNSACTCQVGDDVQNCRRCGQCPIAKLSELAERYGIEAALATGGRQAVAAARQPHIKAVVAVACDRELREGIFAALPKPVLAAGITWPNGPCKDTDICIDAVEEAVQWLLR